jgi:glycosyltransferase involved in cell wall biosynthesis
MPDNKTLLFLIPTLGNGGAERQMVQLIKLLNESNIYPTLLTYSKLGKEYQDKIIVERITVFSSFFALKYLKIIYAIWKINPKVILSFGEIPNIIAIIMSFICIKTKIIVSERNNLSHYNFFVRIRYNLYRRSHYIIVNSQSQTNFIKSKSKFLIGKIKTITNYTDIDYSKLSRKIKGKSIKIGVFGRYHPLKNTLLFLDMVSLLNKKGYSTVEYHWYGENYMSENDIPTKYASYYLKCLKRRDQLNIMNVFLHGHVTEVVEQMNEMDAICLPSISEGFSNALSEAICIGKPILASNVGDNSSFLIENQNGFMFDPYDISTMVSAFENFFNLSDENLNNFEIKSRSLAKNLFSKDKFISHYKDVLFC